MRWNFWHFSLKWRTEKGPLEDLEKNAKRNLAKKIGHSVKAAIANFAKIDIPVYPIINENCYSKN